jgi:hypothetical protein
MSRDLFVNSKEEQHVDRWHDSPSDADAQTCWVVKQQRLTFFNHCHRSSQFV